MAIEQLKKNSILLISGLIVFILILLPLITIFIKAVIHDGRLDLLNAFTVLLKQGNFQTVVNSLVLGTVVVLMSTVLAAPLAFLLSKTEFARHKWIDLVILIPFMTSPFINSMGWILFMQKNGLLQQLVPFTGSLSEQFFSFWGLALVMALHVYSFMVLILKNALLNVNSNLEEAASVLGVGARKQITKIVIPLITGNYAIGALIVFVKTISEYGTPYTFGTRIGFRVFTTDIHRYSTTSPISFETAATLSSILVLICVGIWLVQNRITLKNTYQTVSGKGLRVTRKKFRPISRLIIWFFLGLLILTSVGIPYFSIAATSFIKLRGYGLAKGNFTMQHYIDLFTMNEKGIHAIGNSFFLAVSAATITAVVGTLIVVAIYHRKSKLGKWVEIASLLPEMLPSIVVVIGLMLFWNKFYQVIPLYNTMGLLVLTYSILFLPYTIQYVSSAYSQISGDLLQAGRVFGATQFYILKKITVPLVIKGILAAWSMTFIISLRELVAASIMAPPNTLTISTFIVREFEQGSVAIGMAMAMIYALFTTSILILLNLVLLKKEVIR